tara:strand:+ start:4229 stop:4672 length:444 start_codon:yes stop_codon:yes gene_type:complete
MPTSFSTIYKDIINTFAESLRGEFGGAAKVYIAEEFQRQGNQSIRLENIGQSFNEINDDRFLNSYELEIKFYSIVNIRTDITYKDFFRTVHRIEQFLLASQETFEVGKELLNFKISSIAINDLVDDEVNVNGLQAATFNLQFSQLKG